MLALIAAPFGARAAVGPSAEDSTRHKPSPTRVMFRSAVLPGWGQFTNHKYLKVPIVVGGEGLLIYKAISEFHLEQDAANRGDAAGKDRHMNLKVNYIWWAITAHLFQMADAYVDAHLAGFEADFGPDEADRSGVAGVHLAVALRARF